MKTGLRGIYISLWKLLTVFLDMIGYTKTLWWTTMAMKYHQTFRCFTCWLLVIFQPGWSQWVNWCQAQHAMLRLMIGYKNPSRSTMGEELYIRDDLKLPRVSQSCQAALWGCFNLPLKTAEEKATFRASFQNRFRTCPKNVECGTCGVFSQLDSLTGWWFGTFFIFPYIGNNNSNWLIFFRGLKPPTRLMCCLKIACPKKNQHTLVRLFQSRHS